VSPFWPIRVYVHPALLLAVGIAIGAWLARRQPPTVPELAEPDVQPEDPRPLTLVRIGRQRSAFAH